MMKKIVVCMLVISLTLGLIACGDGSAGGNGKGTGDSKYSDRSVKIKFSYYDGGYGSEWIKAVTEDYMENVNSDVYIEMVPSYDNSTAYADICSGAASADLYQIETSVFGCGEYLAELSDVYESKAYGEEVLIKDKITEESYQFYNENGNYYQMPNTKMTGWNWVYNKTVLDEVLGEGNYTLPRTTDEFFALGDLLFEKNTFLTVGAFADTQGGDYLNYAFENWFAQMVGKKGYNNFFNGLYQDENGEWKLSEKSPMMISTNQAAIEAAYGVAYRLCEKTNHYVYSDSASLNYKGADQVFYGGGYGMNKAKVACLYTGPWIRLEVDDLIEDGIIEDQEIVASRMPVISAITERCSTISNDSVLAAVVDYVDGVNQTMPEGVSEEDAAIVKEARNMLSENVCRSMVVPNSGKNIDVVKDFLRYLASDRAQKISAQHTNGQNLLPFGYVPTEEDMGFEFSEYIKSIYSKQADTVVIDVSMLDKPFTQATNLKWYYDKNAGSGSLAKTIFAGGAGGVEKIFQSTLNYFDTERWATYIENYHLLIGQ